MVVAVVVEVVAIMEHKVVPVVALLAAEPEALLEVVQHRAVGQVLKTQAQTDLKEAAVVLVRLGQAQRVVQV
jgi:hypothetical protein